MSRRRVVWGSGVAVVLGAASGAVINELHQGWPWWLAAAAVTGTGAVLAGRLAAGSTDHEQRTNPDTAAGANITVGTVTGAVGEFHAPVSFDQRTQLPPTGPAVG